MNDKPTFQEMTNRIEESRRNHGGQIPHDLAVAWNGYLAALIEWGQISPDDHWRLLDLLPADTRTASVKILAPDRSDES